MSADTAVTADQYLYGIVLADHALRSDDGGVQGLPVRTVGFGRLAAVVGDLESPDDLGTPDDLLAHTRVLDAIAATDPVLPLAFGTVVPADAAIDAEVLGSDEQQYVDALLRLEGHAQYTLLVRFDRDAALREIIEQNDEAAELRASIAGTTEDQTRPQRIRLGEIVVRTLEHRRPAEAAPILDRLAVVTSEVSEREAGQVEVVTEVAVLVRYDEAETFESAVEDMAERSHDRLRFRLVGPQAPYDFVPNR